MIFHTIGHSNHPIDRFLELLTAARVQTVADVRSVPASRRYPHFSRDRLAAALENAGIAYMFLGRELGGRPADPALWTEGRPDYERMARSPAFNEGMARLHESAAQHTALMCAEKEPLDCHRMLLVSRALAADGAEVRHVLADGTVEPQRETEQRLMDWAAGRRKDFAGADLFETATPLARAYRARADWLWGTGPAKR